MSKTSINPTLTNLEVEMAKFVADTGANLDSAFSAISDIRNNVVPKKATPTDNLVITIDDDPTKVVAKDGFSMVVPEALQLKPKKTVPIGIPASLQPKVVDMEVPPALRGPVSKKKGFFKKEPVVFTPAKPDHGFFCGCGCNGWTDSLVKAEMAKR